MSHKLFIKRFQEKIPQFMHNRVDDIYQDILLKIDEGLKGDGVEFRGYFRIIAHTGKQRNTFCTKLLQKID